MDKYLQYNLEDFLLDDSFVKWVKDKDPEATAFWSEWVMLHTEKQPLIEEAKQAVLALSFEEKTDNREVQNRLWENIKSATAEASNDNISVEKLLEPSQVDKKQSVPEKSKPTIIRRLIPLAAAASVALVLFFTFFNNNSLKEFDTLAGQMETVTLPDGSQVILNSQSELTYDAKNWNNQRQLNLDGEAFFKVEKGKSFIVKTKNGEVEVLGTSFNVFSRNEELFVTCETGKVAVRSESTETILTPNQAVIANKNNHTSVSDAASRGQWRTGKYEYQDVVLEKVTTDLERQFLIDIVLADSLRLERFNGSFVTKDLETALSEVFWPAGIEFKIEGKKVLLKQK